MIIYPVRSFAGGFFYEGRFQLRVGKSGLRIVKVKKGGRMGVYG